MPSNSDNALALVAEGFRVFPVWWMNGGRCACRENGFCRPGATKHEECTPDECKACHPGKHPITPRGLHDASADPEQVRKWWEIAPAANIGIALPDGIVVVDVDPRHGGDATFDRLEAERGFPDTRRALTGGGGAHFYYRVPAGWALPGNLRQLERGEGVDIKQLGGYVLAPPSNHVSGGVYTWVTPPGYPIATAPDWLVSRGHERGASAAIVVDDEDRQADDATLERIVAAVAPHVRHGQMHHLCKNLSGWLKQRGYAPSDVQYVVERLPLKNVRNGVDAARAAFRIERAFGWNELRGIIGEAPAAALDQCTPNPRRQRELAERAAAEQVLAAGLTEGALRREAMRPPLPTGQVGSLAPAPANGNADPWESWGKEIDLTQDPPPMAWVVPELEIGPGRPTAILGYANSAKTPFALALAVGIATGRAVLDMPVTCGRVAWLAYEASRITWGKARRIALGMNATLENMKLFRMQRLLTEPGAVEALLEFVHRKQYLIVFIDTYSSAIAGVDHNSPEFALALRQLERVSDLTGTTFVVLVHSKKESTGALQDFAGHNSAGGAVQVVIGLQRPDPEDKFVVQVNPVRELDRPFKPFRIRFMDDASVGEQIAGGALRLVRVVENAPGQQADPIVVACEKILSFLHNFAPRGEQLRWDGMRAELGGNASNLLAARARLVRAKQITISGSPLCVALAIDAPAWEASAVAPPRPVETVEQSLGRMREALVEVPDDHDEEGAAE